MGNYVLQRHTDSLEHGHPRPTPPTCLDTCENCYGVDLLDLRQHVESCWCGLCGHHVGSALHKWTCNL